MRMFVCAFAVLCLLAPGTGSARPLSIGDLLHLQELASTTIDPSGRWLILEVEAPYDQAARFESWAFSRSVRSRLWIVDLEHPRAARLAFAQRDKAGYLPGPFSPLGKRMLVFRDLDGRREAGALTLATGAVRWFGVGADMADDGDTAVWRSDAEVLLIALDAKDRPLQDRLQLAAMSKLPQLWRQSLKGTGPSVVMQGSGALKTVHPEEPARRLLAIDAATGQRHELAKGDYESFSLSPDGRHVALIAAGDRIQTGTGQLLGPGSEWRSHSVYRLELSTGTVSSPCAGCDVLPTSLRWSSGDSLLFFAKSAGQAWPQGQLRRLDEGRREASSIETPGLKVAFSYAHLSVIAAIHADWLEGEPVVYAEPAPEKGRADWYRLTSSGPINLTADLPSVPARLGAFDGNHVLLMLNDDVWLIDSQGRAMKIYHNAGLKPLASIATYTSVRGTIDAPGTHTAVRVATAEDGAASIGAGGVLWAISGHRPTSTSTPSSTGFGIAARDAPVLAASRLGVILAYRDAHGVRKITLRRPDGCQAVLMTLNPQLAAVDWSRPMPINDPGPHGEPFKDWLYLPKTYQPGSRLPLIMLGYPGMTLPDTPFDGLPGNLQLDDNPQLITAHGYAALIPSISVDPDRTDFGAGLTEATVRALDRAIAQGFVDPNRIAFWGHSGGGYMALRLATETTRFKAIIAAAGAYDLISMHGQTRPSSALGSDWPMDALFSSGWAELGQGHLLATPWSDQSRFTRASPLLSAEKIQTPILLVQGDQDLTGLAQGGEMFAALYRLNKDALFMAFYGEGHTISSPPNVRTYLNGAFAFLDRYLGPQASKAR